MSDQDRLFLERQCAGIFDELSIELVFCDCHGEVLLLRDIGLTLLTFDLAPGHGSWATTLPTAGALVETFEALLTRWEKHRFALQRLKKVEDLGDGHLISVTSLEAAGEFVRKRIRATDGYGLLVGKTPYTRWIARGAREDMVKHIRDELIPSWKEMMS